MRRPFVTLGVAVALVTLAACGPDDGRQLAEPDPDLTAVVPTTSTLPAFSGGSVPLQGIGPDGLTLSSPDFVPGGPLPASATCSGDRSPTMTWTAPGPDVVELALVAQDLDEGNLAQWVVTGIAPTEGRSPAGGAPLGADLRPNSAGAVGWDSPCPGDDITHRIVFTLYALDQPLNVTVADAASVVRAVQDAAAGSASVLGQALPPGP
jgi:phosphatidylethanolamine-binding protein (PEBP) family uncharacterized protein